jgi:hypothetical protein
MTGITTASLMTPHAMDYELGSDLVLAIDLLAIVISVLAMVYWTKLYRKLYKSDRRETQGWAWLSAAVLGILLFNISSTYMLFLNEPVYELINIVGRTLIAVSMTIGAYLLYSPMKKGALYKFVSVTPVAEKEGEKTSLMETVKKGHSYLVEEEKPAKASEVFVDLVTHGVQGLYVTRRYPKEVREAYNLKVTPIIWLTHEKTGEEHINPTDIVELSHTIKEFIKKTGDGVVFIDGLEYLITQNEYKDILKFAQSLNDSIVVSSSRLIIPVDPSSLDAQQLHLLKRDMEVLETAAGK